MNTEVRVTQPVLLWFDCCTTTRTDGLLADAERHFSVERDVGLHRADASIALYAPRVLVADFDFPDRAQLRELQAVRRAHTRLPILMLTVHHSEELAVWALRNRIWNYYVKPCDPGELAHDLAELARITGRWRTDDSHGPSWPAQELPTGLPNRQRRDQFTALRPALAYVKLRYREQVREEEAASLCGLTRFEFSRAFHKAFGLTYIEYVLRMRVREAKRLLRVPGARIADVCYAVGFNDPSYFARVFRQRLGESPADWSRKELERAARPTPQAPEEFELTGRFKRLPK
jgi:AraC-like DNA-binding protein